MLDWKRRIQVRVAGRVFEEEKIHIEIQREGNDNPATGAVSIFNLARTTEQQVESAGDDIVVAAGYQQPSVIFVGTVQRVQHATDINDRSRSTTITLAAQSISRRTLRGVSSIGFQGTRPLRSVASLLVADTGLTLGPLDPIPANLTIADYSYSGPSLAGLTRLLKGHGIYWFEDDGRIRFNSVDLPAQPDADYLTLTPDTGLIGSPATTDDGLVVRSTLKPSARIGGQVALTSRTATGIFKITTLLHQGDNWRGEFFTEMTLHGVRSDPNAGPGAI